MTYQVLARKWRPQVFDAVVGQEPVTRTLQNALASGRVAHAYLFTGPRGVGKTTTARLLAKALVLHRAHRRRGVRRLSLLPGLRLGRAGGRDGDRRRLQYGRRRHPHAPRERQVRARARPLQGLHRRRGPHALRPGVQRLPEDAGGAARPRGLHPGHHRPEEDSRHRAVALPALRLPADPARAAHRERSREILDEGAACPSSRRRCRCSCARPRAACATRSRCSTPPSPTARASSTRRASRGSSAPPRRCTCAAFVTALARPRRRRRARGDRPRRRGGRGPRHWLCREVDRDARRRCSCSRWLRAAAFADLDARPRPRRSAPPARPVSADELIYLLRAFLDADAEMRRSPHPRVELEIAAVRATQPARAADARHPAREGGGRARAAASRRRPRGGAGSSGRPAVVQESLLTPSQASSPEQACPAPAAAPQRLARCRRLSRLARRGAEPRGGAAARRARRRASRARGRRRSRRGMAARREPRS